MNQRIRELKHLASVWCDENIPEQFSEETNGYGKAWEDKFTELIVRECADIVLNGRAKEDEPWDHSFWNQACENRAYAIKEHFGVEE